jgi:hypothetical protein
VIAKLLAELPERNNFPASACWPGANTTVDVVGQCWCAVGGRSTTSGSSSITSFDLVVGFPKPPATWGSGQQAALASSAVAVHKARGHLQAYVYGTAVSGWTSFIAPSRGFGKRAAAPRAAPYEYVADLPCRQARPTSSWARCSSTRRIGRSRDSRRHVGVGVGVGVH